MFYYSEACTLDAWHRSRGRARTDFEVADTDEACRYVREGGSETYTHHLARRIDSARSFDVRKPEGVVVELIEFPR